MPKLKRSSYSYYIFLIFLLIILVISSALILYKTQKNKQQTREILGCDPYQIIPKHIIYADSNGTTPIFPETINAMKIAMKYGYGNPSSIHGLGKLGNLILESQREKMARLLTCKKDEIIFTSGATESNNAIINHILQKYRKKGKKNINIITTPIEHASIAEVLNAHEINSHFGFNNIEIRVCMINQKGRINIDHYKSLMDENSVLSCIIMGNNEIGTIQDISSLSSLHKQKNIHLHLDMTQIIGRYFVALDEMNIDSATMSAHKFHGPKGVGCLYFCKKNISHNDDEFIPFIRGGHQEDGQRGGTENLPGIVGMSNSLSICIDYLFDKKNDKMKRMKSECLDYLEKNIPELIIFGDQDHSLYNTISISVPVNSRQLVKEMNDYGIYIGTGCACSKGGASAVLKALGYTEKEINGSLRISFNFMNNSKDALSIAKTIVELVNKNKNKIVDQEESQNFCSGE